MNRNLSGCYMYVLCSGYISAEGRRGLDMNRAQSLNSDWMDVPGWWYSRKHARSHTL